MDLCAGSLQFVRARVARLAADGKPLVGAGNVYVTKAVRLSWDPDIAEGEEFEQKNGAGEICINFKDDDRLKGLNMQFQICNPDPWLHAMLAGGQLLTEGADVVGYQYPRVGETANPDGVSIEGWAKAITGGKPDPDFPYFRWVFPRVTFRIGEKALENAIMSHPFVGYGTENSEWYDGPANDWYDLTDQAALAVAQFARDEEIPDATCGAEALAAS